MTKFLNAKTWAILFLLATCPGKSFKAQTNNSVLAQGNWYKIKISGSGLHKVSFEFLKSIGYPTENLLSNEIKLYGNSSGMLPFNNSIYRPDDLLENAILIHDGDDGNFGPGDYFLFYGIGADTWKYDSPSNAFKHTKHFYDSFSYFFLSRNSNVPLRAKQQVVINEPEVGVITKFTDHQFYEKDNENLVKSGRVLYGEKFDATESYNFDFNFPNLVTGSTVQLTVDMAMRSTPTASTIGVKVNGSNQIPMIFDAANGSYAFADRNATTYKLNGSSDNISVNLTLNRKADGATAWLNFIEVSAIRKLSLASNSLSFRTLDSINTSQVIRFDIENANSNCTVLDITNPVTPEIISTYLENGKLAFKAYTDTLHEYIVFNGSNFTSPTFVGKVANQNLHNLSDVDMVILSHPDFYSEASRLAELHRSEGLTVELLKPEVVYNEFSSGAKDVTAIKDLMKMLYNKANGDPELKPKYLLLFGDGSYINHDYLGNTNFLPTFQSEASESYSESFVSDDYFGFLDPTEGESTRDKVDIGVGRLPASSVTQATEMVNKIVHYVSTGYEPDQASPFGDWRNRLLFVADDLSGNPGDSPQPYHQEDADDLTIKISQNNAPFLTDKIYMDAYKEISTPGGERYPDAARAFRNKVQQGALIVNYTGHGGEVGLAHERILDIPTINDWTNYNSLPLFVTATCEFSRFDDPSRTSAGELILLNPKGGGIGLLSTTRLVFSQPNAVLNSFFYDYALPDSTGKSRTLGEITQLTKANAAQNSSFHNHMNFMLLGDPALRLAYPKHKVTTTRINGTPIGELQDTLKAFDKVVVDGSVTDQSGALLSGFNGVVDITVFDKPQRIKTLGNDAPIYREFTVEDQILHRGRATVTNGQFSFEFIVPKDISFAYGNGNIVYYANNGIEDANGGFKNIIVGGVSGNTISDNQGPDIQLYLNNTDFNSGDFTDENPSLLAYVSDDLGINTTGNGIGHEILATLDDDAENAITLNTYYQADLDTYQRGKITYPFFKLAEGNHTLTLKVWDINNNSASATTNFIVANSSDLKIENLINYPNPVMDETTFSFDHNQLGKDLSITIDIYDAQGKIIKTIQQAVNEEAYYSRSVKWDCTTNGGHTIERGVYVYRLTVQKADGSEVSKTNRLLVLK